MVCHRGRSAIYLHRLRIPGETLWPRVGSALKDKLIEFLVIVCAVLLFYGVLEWHFSQLALDSTTLEVISEWEKRVREVHERLERLKLGWEALAALLVLIYALRVIAQVNPHLARLEVRASAAVVLAVRWFARISTAFALAAGLTFLATAEGAKDPVGRIGLTLADAGKEYAEFQRALDARIDSEVRAQLLSRAWTARPMPMILGMREFSQINDARKAVEAQIVKDNVSLELLGVPESSYKTYQPAYDRAASDDAPAGHWTPEEVRTANEAAKRLPDGAFHPGATRRIAGRFSAVSATQLTKEPRSRLAWL